MKRLEHPRPEHPVRTFLARSRTAQANNKYVISVDTKKKELIGDFKNGGREWQPKGEPERVRVHDFVDNNLGKAIPYGVYDISRNEGWVSVGIDHRTAHFATNTIRQWWRKRMAPQRTPTPGTCLLLPTAAGPTVRAGGDGSLHSRTSQIARGSRSTSVTCRRGPASGTRSSTGCSVTSRRTGEAGRLRTSLPWYVDRGNNAETSLKVEAPRSTRSYREGRRGQQRRDEMPRTSRRSVPS